MNSSHLDIRATATFASATYCLPIGSTGITNHIQVGLPTRTNQTLIFTGGAFKYSTSFRDNAELGRLIDLKKTPLLLLATQCGREEHR
ncbi:unnamed protein product [Protopolystoma xenopodis]|uniref:Uncharacterized protein n=1 Tax=Protopolystoma xenopodis TaxID=117903 RepID=A0A448XMR3_9PLAT|nr:unnamed protein product [Protopolystoma xenopodis]